MYTAKKVYIPDLEQMVCINIIQTFETLCIFYIDVHVHFTFLDVRCLPSAIHTNVCLREKETRSVLTSLSKH